MNVQTLGQVFTPPSVVQRMISLRKNFGNVLEPSCGNGAFSDHLLPNVEAIELDQSTAPPYAKVMDFFDFTGLDTFETIIGNPPYVRFQDILTSTKKKLTIKPFFDERTNLYLFFIEKCLRLLSAYGEMIFITPRDFLKSTSSLKLNQVLYELGTITDWIELGDKQIFEGFTPNCAIWRFEKGNFSRQTKHYENEIKRFRNVDGQLFFTQDDYTIKFSEVFFVKVGAVSGHDGIFVNDEIGNREFVCSSTRKDGNTRKMIFNQKNSALNQYKSVLLNRRVKKFSDDNWWTWGRMHYMSLEKRIYVNCKTRHKRPFFLHRCNDYDGSVLAIFPKFQEQDTFELCNMLNEVNWEELGFVCDGRFIFSQRSLENALLPEGFRKFLLPSIAGNTV